MQKQDLKKHLLDLFGKKQSIEERRKNEERRLINAESSLGRQIFGAVAEDYKREFFCLSKNVWLWYENGSVIRYEVREDGVFKKVNDGHSKKIEGEELAHFRSAVKTYTAAVKQNIYK